jgi:hypothetical protein
MFRYFSVQSEVIYIPKGAGRERYRSDDTYFDTLALQCDDLLVYEYAVHSIDRVGIQM